MVSNEVLERFVQRERSARKEAERLLEERSRQLYQSNATLTQMAAALEDEVRRTQAIVETAAEGIITFDSNGNIESINTAAQSIFEYDFYEAIGKKYLRSDSLGFVLRQQRRLCSESARVYENRARR